MAAERKVLDDLHTRLAQAMLDKLTKDGEIPSASDLNVIRQFLKDNDVETPIGSLQPMLKITQVLPFENGEESATGT